MKDLDKELESIPPIDSSESEPLEGTSSSSPMVGASFLSFEWDEFRRQCTIKATVPGAKRTRVSAGYAPNDYNIGTKVTSGESGTLVVKDLAHGNGEVLYLEARSETTDAYQHIDEVAKISIPIPNPILGVLIPSCGQIVAGEEKKYIVDIIEKKKGLSTCTPRWQVGDRVVMKAPCPLGGGIAPPGAVRTTLRGGVFGNRLAGNVTVTDKGFFHYHFLYPNVVNTSNDWSGYGIVRDVKMMENDGYPLDTVYMDFSEVTNAPGEYDFWLETISGNPGADDYTFDLKFYKQNGNGGAGGAFLPIHGTKVRTIVPSTTWSIDLDFASGLDASNSGTFVSGQYKHAGDDWTFAIRWEKVQ